MRTTIFPGVAISLFNHKFTIPSSALNLKQFAMKNILLPALLLLVSFFSHAQVGSPDPSFGKNGIQTAQIKTNFSKERPKKVISLPDGRFLVVMQLDLFSFSGSVVVRYHADGSVDTSFGKNGYSDVL